MATQISQYQQRDYHLSKGLSDAVIELENAGGAQVIHEYLAPIFLKHGIAEQYGVGLRHRHFEMQGMELLVDVRGSASPIPVAENLVFPTIFGLSEDGQTIRPLEFSIQPANVTPLAEVPSNFLSEFWEAATKLSLEKLITIAAHPGPDFRGRLEITVGRSNINLSPEEGAELFPADKNTDAAWYFDEGYRKHGCKCQCSTTNGPHSHLKHYVVV